MTAKKDIKNEINTSKFYISYVHGDQKCEVCEKLRELRMGFCFACADAQSIIADGVDMQDKEDHIGTQISGSEATARLKKMIENGWANNEPD